MAKIWLKIWLKVKENGTKKIKLAKMVAKEKEILVRTLYYTLKPIHYLQRDSFGFKTMSVGKIPTFLAHLS